MDHSDLKPHVINLKNSDKTAFRIVFTALQQNIYNFLLFKTNDKALAEDLLQDTFIKLWENRKKLKEDESLRAWLYKVAGNLYLNHLRHAGVMKKHQDEVLTKSTITDIQHPHFVLEEQEFQERLINAIGSLPERVKEVFLMSRTEALTNKEISERLGISIKTIESQLGKALKILCKSMPEKYFLKRAKKNQVK